jgi:DNA-directed RNA polymerase specialized sigma24 family protein
MSVEKQKSGHGSITAQLSAVLRGDEKAFGYLYRRMSEKFKIMLKGHCKTWDPPAQGQEDVMQNALLIFCRGIQENKFETLKNRGHVEALFERFIGNQFKNQLRHDNAKKRNGDLVQGDSVLKDIAAAGGQSLHEVSDHLVSATIKALDALADRELMTIAQLLLGGRSKAQIMTELEMTRHTLDRKLQLIGRIWTEHAQQD